MEGIFEQTILLAMKKVQRNIKPEVILGNTGNCSV